MPASRYFLKNLLRLYLKFWAKLALFRQKPRIIAVAGSINKPFFQAAIVAELQKAGYTARQNSKNFNTEIGLPLAILDLPSGYNSYKDWLPQIWAAPRKAWQPQPQFLVLSLGSAAPGDMKYLLSIVKPEIAVITEITQRHLEAYQDMDELADEYEKLAQKIKNNGLLVLNKDNCRVYGLKNQTKAAVRFFSLAATGNSDVEAVNIEKKTIGYEFEIWPEKKKVHCRSFGQHHIQSYLAAHLIRKYVAEKKLQTT